MYLSSCNQKSSSIMQRSHNQSILSLGFRIYTTWQNIIDHMFTKENKYKCVRCDQIIIEQKTLLE
jgi:ribose 5-phosphate isomerase RpiB